MHYVAAVTKTYVAILLLSLASCGGSGRNSPPDSVDQTTPDSRTSLDGLSPPDWMSPGDGTQQPADSRESEIPEDVSQPDQQSDAQPAPSGPLMGFLQFHLTHNLAQPDCYPLFCNLQIEETQNVSGWLDKLAADSSLAVLHFDRAVPWHLFAQDVPSGLEPVAYYDALLDDEMRGWLDAFVPHFDRLPRSYLAVSLLNGSRTGAQNQRQPSGLESESTGSCPTFSEELEVTVDPDGTGEVQPVTLKLEHAYLNLLLYLYDKFQPDYMAIVVEANIFRQFCPAQWPSLVGMYHRLYDQVKAHVKPGVPVFATLTVAQLLAWNEEACFKLAFVPCEGTQLPAAYSDPAAESCFPLDAQALWDLDEGNRMDLLGLSFYPDAFAMQAGDEGLWMEMNGADWNQSGPCLYRAPYGPYVDPLSQLKRLNWSKPVAMAEWSARSCRTWAYVEAEGAGWWASPDSTEGSQQFWMQLVLDHLRSGDLEFAAWSFYQDYDPLGLWLLEKKVLDAATLSLFNAWPCSGVTKLDETPKEGLLAVWRKALSGE